MLLAGWLLLRPYLTDDTYIHLRYARNLIERGELSFNPGEATYGATSPLWVLGLAGLLAAGAPPVAAAKGLGLLAGLLTLLVAGGLLRGLRLPAGWRAAVLLLVAADAWLVRWAASGMETPLAAALLTALLWPILRPPPPARAGRALLAWGALAGLAGLTRPEFLLVGPTALPWVVWRLRRRGPAAPRAPGAAPLLGSAALGWLVAVLPWLLYARHAFGRLTPETAAAKSGTALLAPAALLASAARSAGQLAAVQAPLWAAVLAVGALALLAARRRPAAAGTIAAAGDRGGGRGGAGGADAGEVALVGAVATWALVLAGGYAVKQVWVISRYLAPLTPPLLLALAAVARWSVGALAGRGRRLALALLAAGAVGTAGLDGWWLLARVRPHAVAFGRDLHGCYHALGEWLRTNTPPGAVVAALDIGAVGWASQRRVLDLMGLVSPRLMELGRRLGFEEMVAGGRWLEVEVPDYLVDRTAGPPRWVDRTVRGVRFELLRTCTLAGVGLREPEPWTVALYRLRRVGEPPAAGPGPAPESAPGPSSSPPRPRGEDGA